MVGLTTLVSPPLGRTTPRPLDCCLRPTTSSDMSPHSSQVCDASAALCRALGLRALVEGLLGDHGTDGKTLGAREVSLAESKIGLRLGKARLRLRQRGLERPAIDREQEVALAHDLAVAK